jgi:hypothetical protein
MIDTSAAMQTRWPESRPPLTERATLVPEPPMKSAGMLRRRHTTALSEQMTRLYKSEDRRTGVDPEHGYAAISGLARMNLPGYGGVGDAAIRALDGQCHGACRLRFAGRERP